MIQLPDSWLAVSNVQLNITSSSISIHNFFSCESWNCWPGQFSFLFLQQLFMNTSKSKIFLWIPNRKIMWRKSGLAQTWWTGELQCWQMQVKIVATEIETPMAKTNLPSNNQQKNPSSILDPMLRRLKLQCFNSSCQLCGSTLLTKRFYWQNLLHRNFQKNFCFSHSWIWKLWPCSLLLTLLFYPCLILLAHSKAREQRYVWSSIWSCFFVLNDKVITRWVRKSFLSCICPLLLEKWFTAISFDLLAHNAIPSW